MISELENSYSYSIEVNPHKLDFQTVGEYIKGKYDWHQEDNKPWDWVDTEDMEKCIKDNTIVLVMCYPRTHVAWWCVAGSSLGKVLAYIEASNEI